jgi:sulfatase maturation enzyme AslB (radical SAM superfamily)
MNNGKKFIFFIKNNSWLLKKQKVKIPAIEKMIFLISIEGKRKPLER